MEHISLYRKWRPQLFGDVIGQPHVTNTLANALSSGRVVHAYLFCGPRGTGKTSTARILAKAINCVEGPTAEPCNVCDACISISEGTALDVIEIDAASNRKIDEIRELLEKIPYSPTSLRSKVYIIDEVHQLTSEASAALLKTLEEPPGHVVFVLATTEPQKILPTIVSRCQRFDFSLVPTPEITDLLGRIASSEELEIEPEAIGMIAEHAHGSVRDAIGVMEQISSMSGESVTQEQVGRMLGEVESDLVFDMIDAIIERETPIALVLVGKAVDSGKEPLRFVESLISHLRSLFLIQNAANPKEVVEATDEHYRRLEERASRMKRYEVVRLIEGLGQAHRDMRWSENPRLIFECALVKVTGLDVDVTAEGLIFRIEELENKVDRRLDSGSMARATETAAKSTAAERAKAVASDRKEDAEPARSKVESPPGKTDTDSEGPDAGVDSPETAVTTEVDVTPAEAAGDEPGAPAEEMGEAPEGGDREKARRAWMAVLSELKKQGKMRSYALLRKAKILDAGEGGISLGFKDDATFQLEALKDSDDLGMVEEICAKFMEGPVRLRLEVVSGATGVEPTGEKTSKKASERGAGPDREKKPSRRAGGSSREVAERIKEQFDGQIIEDGRGGKE